MIAKKIGRNEAAGSPSRTGTITRDACATWNKLLFVGWLVVPLNVGLMLSANAAESSLKFAGIPFSPGSTVRANVPLNAQEKSYAGQGGNPIPQSAVAVLATPANFDPRKSWPVLVPCSTSDFKRQNRDDLVQFYQRVGLAEGWVLLAGDGPPHLRDGSAGGRPGPDPPAAGRPSPRGSRAGEGAGGWGRVFRGGQRGGAPAARLSRE